MANLDKCLKREKFASFSFAVVVGNPSTSDNNAPNRLIPAYSVWDLSAEAKVWRDTVSIIAGVNNLFGTNYYARIRADGIDPAAPTNWYAGVKVEF